MIYSFLVENWVFVATGFFLLLTAVVGQLTYLGNKRREARKGVDTGARKTEPA